MEAVCTLPSLWLEVQIKKGPMSAKKSACVAVIYRPHHAHRDWEESLLSSISEFRSRHTDLALMIGGDFNVDIMTRDSDKLRENMRLGGMLWQVTGPTRYDSFHGSASTVDHVWVEEERWLKCSKVDRIVMDSDHLGLGLCIGVKPVDRERPAKWIRSWKNFEPENFVEELNCVDWEKVTSGGTTATGDKQGVVDNMCEVFTSKFLSVLDEHAPRKFYAASEQKRHRRGKKPWIDRKLISLIRRKDRLRQMACRSPLSAPVHAEYKRIREQFSKNLKRRHREFVKGKMEAAGNDQKKLWKALAEITGYKELDREDTTEISAQSFADMLKAHMSSSHPPMGSVHPATETTTGPSFEIKQVSVEAVKIALQNIDTNKATGIDLIPPRALQHAASRGSYSTVKHYQYIHPTTVLPEAVGKGSCGPCIQEQGQQE